MKKLLGLMLVLALVVPAKADIFQSFDTTGEIQLLGNMNRNMGPITGSTTDGYRNTTLRVLFGVQAGLTEDVKANLTFAFGRMWGTNVTAATPSNPNSIESYLDNVYVAEANVELSNLFGAVEAKIGRQFYGNEDSLVMFYGPNHYNSERSTWHSLDAAVFTYKNDMLSVTGMYGKVQESSFMVPVQEDLDITIAGLDATVSFTDELKLQAYVYDTRHGGDDTDMRHNGFWGVKPSFTTDAFMAAVEYARNYSGKDFMWSADDDNYVVKADAAMYLGNITPRAMFLHSNGFAGMGNYTPGLIYGQGLFAGHLTQRVQLANLGVDFTLEGLDKWTFTAEGFGVYGANFGQELGYEADAWVKYAHTENVELHLAGGAMKLNGQSSIVNKIQAGMIVKF